MSTQAVVPGVSGLPPGAVVTPLRSAPAPSTVSGLPPGAVLTPVGSSTPAEDTYSMLDGKGQRQSVSASELQDRAGAGWTPANMHEARRIQSALPKVRGEGALASAADALSSGTRINPVGDDLAVGIAHGAARTFRGVQNIDKKLFRIPDQTADGQPNTSQFAQDIDELADRPNSNLTQAGGELGENVAEYLLPEGMAKLGISAGMKISEAMGMATSIAKVAEKFPVLRPILEQALAGAGQGYVDSGGNTRAALTEGAFTGGGTGVIGGAAKLGTKVLQRLAPEVEQIAGVEHAVPAELRNAKPTAAQAAGQQSIENTAKDTLRRNLEEVNESRAVPASAPGLPERTGPYEFRIKGTPISAGTSEKMLYPADSVPVGESEVPRPQAAKPWDESSAQSDEERNLYSYLNTLAERGQVHESPTVTEPAGTQYLTGVKPGSQRVAEGASPGFGELKTQDANVATGHLTNLNRLIESPAFEQLAPEKQTGYLDQRADMQRQLGEYRRQVQQSYPGYGQPNFEQIDIPREVQKVGSYTDAASNLESHATDIYKHFNDLTDNKFNAIRQENKDAWKSYIGASGTSAQDAAENAINESNRKMQELMESINHAVTPKELDGANDAYRNAQTLHAISQAVDGSFSGNSSQSARSWEYRGFNGNQLMGNLNKLTRKLGRPAIERVMGRENLDALYQVARLNMTNAGRSRFGEAVGKIAEQLQRHGASIPLLVGTAGGTVGHLFGHGYAGALAAETLYGATHLVANAIKTNPKVAQNLVFAIESGARPEHYVPFIAGLVAKHIKDGGNQ